MNHHPQKLFARFSVLIAVMFACCAVLLVLSCSKKPSTAIIGKWLYPGGSGTIEFRKDGTVTLTHDTGRNNMEGTYRFTDANHMTLQMAPADNNTKAPQKVDCIVQVHDDSMDWEIVQGQTHLTRHK